MRYAMTDQDVKKLSRADLLELLLAQLQENQQLRAQLEETKRQLAERKIDTPVLGSLAEAASRLDAIFQAADRTAQQYQKELSSFSDDPS